MFYKVFMMIMCQFLDGKAKFRDLLIESCPVAGRVFLPEADPPMAEIPMSYGFNLPAGRQESLRKGGVRC